MTSYELEVVAPGPCTFVDLTERAAEAVETSGVIEGSCIVFCSHTTCSLVINEGEDGAHEDLLARLRRLVPPHGYFAHDDLGRRNQNLQPDERANGWAHVAQMMIGGTSHSIPIAGGSLRLGRWQRLFLLELDEPKERTVVIQVMGDKGRHRD